jgi:transposase
MSSTAEGSFVSALKSTLKTEPVEVRRFEVITGAGGRRRWSVDEKARIIAETLESGANVSAIARRHGLWPQQIFTWRRQARCAVAGSAEGMAFAPVVVDQPATVPEPRNRKKVVQSPVPVPIEVKIGKAVVQIREGADPRALAAVVRALKRTR